MYSSRLQVLLSPEQRRHLEEAAERLGVSLNALVREAIDAKLEVVEREDKIRAWRELTERPAITAPEIDELEELFASQHGT